LFSSEANYTFSLSVFRLASCLGYYDNAGWNKQLGIRQQLSASVKEKIGLDVQLGYKKAIQTLQPQLAQSAVSSVQRPLHI